MSFDIRNIVKINNTYYVSLDAKWVKKHEYDKSSVCKVKYFKDFVTVHPVKIK